MVNTQALRARMKELDVKNQDVADAIGCAEVTARQKLNNTRAFTLQEAETVQKLLQIQDADFGFYFFDGVSRSATK